MTEAANQCTGEVLIVEDDRAIRRLLALTFKHEGLKVTTAEDGMEAIEVMENHPFRVLVLDLMMPRLNGWGVIEWLKQRPAAKPSTVIVVSAGNRESLNELEPSVVNAVLFKPFDVYQLAAYVRAACTAPVKRDRRAKRVVVKAGVV